MAGRALILRPRGLLRHALDSLTLHAPRWPWSRRRAPRAQGEDEARRLGFTFAVIGLSAALARGGEALSRETFLAFREVFPLEDDASALIRSLFNLAWKERAEPRWFAEQITRLYPDDTALWKQLLKRLCLIALADGALNRHEIAVLREAAAVFRINRLSFGLLLSEIQSGRAPNPLQVLGLPRGASSAEIKRQYRALMRRYHPDHARFRYPEAQAVAERKARALSAAYGRLSR